MFFTVEYDFDSMSTLDLSGGNLPETNIKDSGVSTAEMS